MPLITIIFGGMLTGLGIAGFLLTGSQHYTALIPAIIGTLLEFCGGLAMKPQFRKHAMHAAAMIALIGLLGSASGLIQLSKWAGGQEPANPSAAISKSIMAGLCLFFVVLCIGSFVKARRNRESAGFPMDPSS